MSTDDEAKRRNIAKKLFNEVRQTLFSHKANTRCSSIITSLEALGFSVRSGKSGGHKIFVHDGLADFYSSSFNCGHGKNPEVKPAYVKKAITLLDKYKEELIDFLMKKDEAQ